MIRLDEERKVNFDFIGLKFAIYARTLIFDNNNKKSETK